jgi:hypothetical protein
MPSGIGTEPGGELTRTDQLRDTDGPGAHDLGGSAVLVE